MIRSNNPHLAGGEKAEKQNAKKQGNRNPQKMPKTEKNNSSPKTIP